MQIEEDAIHRAEGRGRYLYNCSHHTKAEFNNCFIIHSKYFKLTNLAPRRLSSKTLAYFRHSFRI